MKDYLPVVLFCFFLMLTACDKSASSTITGYWNVISDFTTTTGPGIYYNVYNGSTGDYFNFSSNGNLYIKESSLYDTIKYTLTSSDTILLPGIGYSINGVTAPSILTLNGKKARIVANARNITPPGHQYQRIINLER